MRKLLALLSLLIGAAVYAQVVTLNQHIGKGCTTAAYIDKDCDGYGTAKRADGDYGPLNNPGAEPPSTAVNMGDMPDADDNDPAVNTVASWRIKYGGGSGDTTIATLRTFLAARSGYTPTRIAFVDTVGGNDSTADYWDSSTKPTVQAYGTAYKTVAAANSAFTGVIGGAMIFRSGAYSEELSETNSGTSGNPLIYMAYPGEVVLMTSTGPFQAYGFLFASPAKGHIRLDGLQFQPITNLVHGSAITGNGMVDVIIRNCESAQWSKTTFIGDYTRDLIIEENVMHDDGQHSIYLGYTSLQGHADQEFVFAANDALYANPADTSCITQNNTNNFWDAPTRCTGNAQHVWIRNNLFYRGGGGGFESIHVNAYTSDVHIDGNIVHNTGTKGIGIQTAMYDSEVVNNVIFANANWGMIVNQYEGACYPEGYPTDLSNPCHRQASQFRRLKIANNTFWVGNGEASTAIKIRNFAPGGGIEFAGPEATPPGHYWSKDVTIENNIIATQNSPARQALPGGAFNGPQAFYFGQDVDLTTFTIRNNIIYNLDSGRSSSDVIMRIGPNYPYCQLFPVEPSCGNVLDEPGTAYTFSAFTAFNAAWTGNTVANPLLTFFPADLQPDHPELFNLTLGAGSPGIGAAITADAPALDARGVSRTSPADIGAYKFVPASCSITTSSLPGATIGVPYSQTLAESGCGSSLSWGGWTTCGGLSLNTGTGVISGTPSGSPQTCSGTLTYDTATQALSVVISGAPAGASVATGTAVGGGGVIRH